MAVPQVPPPQVETETERPTRWSLWMPWLKTLLLSLVIATGLLLLTAVGVAGWGYFQLTKFAQAAETTPRHILSLAVEGLAVQPTATGGRKNILILGIDQLALRGQTSPLTDTMLLVSLDLDTAEVTTLPFPRDVWSQEFQTKINALLFYGEERSPRRPEQFPTTYLEGASGINIHHTVVISLEQVARIIDQLGGVEVDIEQSFTDTQFPRPNVDVTVERDPAKLYKTVSFQAGRESMSGQRALEYIRSRHSDGQTGNDVNRSQRQQAVIEALMRRLTQPSTLRDVELTGQLFRQYLNEFDRYLALTQLLATARTLFPVRDQLSFQAVSLSIFPEDPDGVLEHPPVGPAYNNQWVYVIRDKDAFAQEIAELLE